MSMIPFFPSLRPMYFGDDPWEETSSEMDTEISNLEKEHHKWVKSKTQIACDLQPIGKMLTTTLAETDDEDGVNDDSEDTDSHDDEDEEEMELEASGPPNEAVEPSEAVVMDPSETP